MGRKGIVSYIGACLIALLVVGICLSTWAASEGKLDEKNGPRTNNGQKWKIAYCETDPYANYAETFYAIIKGLEKNGWIEGIDGLPYVNGQSDTKAMWNWLSTHNVGPYIEFVPDAHYSMISLTPEQQQGIIKRLAQTKDINLVIAMGTKAGQLLANDRHHVPVLVFSSSNAVQSGIIRSESDSGRDHIWAHVDSGRYRRQLEVFHDIFHFKKLGIVYENSPEGKVYAAIDDVEAVAKERGFEIVRYYVNEPNTTQDQTRYYNELLAANRKLSREVDAVYVTAGKWNPVDLPRLMQPFYSRNIPTFSQFGTSEVQHGVLLSLYRANFNGLGTFGADTISQVLQGRSLRQLPQVYGDTPSIVLNLEVANRIGYKVPFDILLVADKVYSTIDTTN